MKTLTELVAQSYAAHAKLIIAALLLCTVLPLGGCKFRKSSSPTKNDHAATGELTYGRKSSALFAINQHAYFVGSVSEKSMNAAGILKNGERIQGTLLHWQESWREVVDFVMTVDVRNFSAAVEAVQIQLEKQRDLLRKSQELFQASETQLEAIKDQERRLPRVSYELGPFLDGYKTATEASANVVKSLETVVASLKVQIKQHEGRQIKFGEILMLKLKRRGMQSQIDDLSKIVAEADDALIAEASFSPLWNDVAKRYNELDRSLQRGRYSQSLDLYQSISKSCLAANQKLNQVAISQARKAKLLKQMNQICQSATEQIAIFEGASDSELAAFVWDGLKARKDDLSARCDRGDVTLNCDDVLLIRTLSQETVQSMDKDGIASVEKIFDRVESNQIIAE